MVHALRSRRVVTPAGERDAVVVIDGECIAAIKAAADVGSDISVDDLGSVALLPGLVDAHTHINEPGRTEWEGFATATRAAAAGGFTTVADMPLNCLPETTDVAALEMKRVAAGKQCMIDYALWGGCVDGNQAALEPLAEAGVAGFKSFLIYPGCDGFTAIDHANLELALPHIARTGLPLLVHAELEGPINAAFAELEHSGANWRRYATYLASRPDQAEIEAIAMLIELCRAHRFRLHIVHLSTAQALAMIREARREGLTITVETCPHYLHCAAEDIADGATLFKCAPPIRSRANRELLWDALRDGTLDLIATDHSPCPPMMKRLTATQPGEEAGRFDQAWGGIASLSTALSVVWTDAAERGFTLAHIAQWMSLAPARLAGIDAVVGSIEVGKHADLVAFDADASCVVTAESLHYRHKISPYLGETLLGVVRGTWLRGARVYDGAGFPAAARGREHALFCAHSKLPQNERDTMSQQHPVNRILEDWNRMEQPYAMQTILPCNGSEAWAIGVVNLYPFETPDELFAASDKVWNGLPEKDWQQAFDAHPRIGEQKARAATEQSLQWSAGEQSKAAMDAATRADLAAANEAYEAKFGRIFIVCATGKTAAEMLEILKARMANDPATELKEAAEQQRQITQLRLRKWLQIFPEKQ